MNQDNHEISWKAVCDSDTQFDDIFVYAVKTTGIFCKPSCRSRQPLRKNVSFFATADLAIKSGYRACLRCKP